MTMAAVPNDDDSGDEGQIFNVADDDAVTDTDDGGAIVKLGETEPSTPPVDETDFYRNLAVEIDRKSTRLNSSPIPLSRMLFFFLMKRAPPRSTLFPSTTLFRSAIVKLGETEPSTPPVDETDFYRNLAVE